MAVAQASPPVRSSAGVPACEEWCGRPCPRSSALPWNERAGPVLCPSGNTTPDIAPRGSADDRASGYHGRNAAGREDGARGLENGVSGHETGRTGLQTRCAGLQTRRTGFES